MIACHQFLASNCPPPSFCPTFLFTLPLASPPLLQDVCVTPASLCCHVHHAHIASAVSLPHQLQAHLANKVCFACFQALASLQDGMASFATTFTAELGALKQSLSTQAAEHSAINSALIERFSAQIISLQTRMEAQASEYDRFKSSIWSLMTELLRPLRVATTQQSTQYAALQTAFSDQLTDLKTTHTVQHGDLVDVRAALHAVCPQIEAFKAMPAAVAKHVQGLRLQPGSVVKTGGPKPESSTDAKEWSSAHKVCHSLHDLCI